MPINYGTNDVSTSGNFVASSGNFSLLQVASGVLITNAVPNNTTDALYNDNGTLKFNGSAVGGGGGSYNKSYASTLMFG